MPTPNIVKMNSSYVSNTIGKNGVYLGVDNSIDYGTTATSDFWNGYSPGASGYTIYIKKATNGPSIYSPASDAILLSTAANIALSRIESPTLLNVADALTYLNSKSDMICVNADYPNIITTGLVLFLDSAFTVSYPKGGTGWSDLSTSSKTAVLTNGVGYVSTNGGSLTYSASSLQFVDVPDLGSLSQFTVCCWFKLNSLPTTAGAAAVVANIFTGSNLNFSIGLNNSPSSANICGGFFNGAWRTTSGFAPSTGIWYNVVVTYNGTQIVQYLDGISQSTLNYTGTAASSGAGIRIGRRWDNSPTAADFIDGEIPVVYIYNRSLSASEVLTNYNSLVSRYVTVVDSGLILNWDIQDSNSYSGSGTTINDLESNSNGSIVGTATYTSGLTKYLSLSGSSTNYITTSTSLNSDLSPVNSGTSISVFVWVYPTSNGTIVSEQGSSSPDSGWYDSQIELVNGTMKFRVWNLGSPYLSSSIATPLNAWYFVGFTYASNTLTAYVNGQSAGTASVTRLTPFNNGGGLGLFYNLGYPTGTNMGSNDGADFRFGGLQVYNRAISAADVNTNYLAKKSSYGL